MQQNQVVPNQSSTSVSSSISKSSKRAVLSPSPPVGSQNEGGSSSSSSSRSASASQAAAASAAVAAAVDATCANRSVLPGLAALFFAPRGAGLSGVVGGYSSTGEAKDKSGFEGDASGASSSDGIRHPSLPSLDALSHAAHRSVIDSPPFVHISARDSAPQLKIEDPPAVSPRNARIPNAPNDSHVQRKFIVRGGMRGYRMARASHGAARGSFYYEALILEPPPARDIVAGIVNHAGHASTSRGGSGSYTANSSGSSPPTNIKLGRRLKHTLQEGLIRDEITKQRKEREKNKQESSSSEDISSRKKRKANVSSSSSDAIFSSNPVSSPNMIAHVRIGWSMRTGDLQAPVGYDKWSYAIRDTMGSRVHNSRREDNWGGFEFGPGDVVGFAVCLINPTSDLTASSDQSYSVNGGNSVDTSKRSKNKDFEEFSAPTNHIRFFKNGEPMGNFIVSQGKRYGGKAFDNITPGTYYPAVSCYMGGSVRLNFGPHFVYTPRGLPTGMKLKPVSELCPSPPLPDEAVQMTISGSKEGKKIFTSKRTDENIILAFKELVREEASIRYEAYKKHIWLHAREIWALREERGLSTTDILQSLTSTPSLVEEADKTAKDKDDS